MSPHAPVSPFYALLEPARPYELRFPRPGDPSSDEADGLAWDAAGRVVVDEEPHWEVEDVDLVDLGNGRYRIAVPALFSSISLDWGDEFLGEVTGDAQVTIRAVVLPLCFRHYRWISSGPMDRGNSLAELVHRLGGGWATVAGGMWTLTVPESMVDAFVVGLRDIDQIRERGSAS